MIKTYKIIDCICRDEFDFEVVARVLDVETNVEMCVLINDYSLDQFSDHVDGIYKQLQAGNLIKGELFVLFTQQLDATGVLFFKPRITCDYFKLSAFFEGEFIVDILGENGSVVLDNPNLKLTIKSDADEDLNTKLGTVHLTGELYLKTVGIPF